MVRSNGKNVSGRKRKKTAQKMTSKQLQLEKDVKRINERINEIAKKYGTGSYAYNKYYSAVVMGLPQRFRRFSKHGIIQISRSKELYDTAGTPETEQAFTRLLGLKTSGQLRKAAKKSLMDEMKAKKKQVQQMNKKRAVSGLPPLPVPVVTEQQIKQRELDIDRVNEFVADNRAMFYMQASKSVDNLIHTKGRRKTYGEMIQIINAYQKGGGMDSRNLFEGL